MFRLLEITERAYKLYLSGNCLEIFSQNDELTQRIPLDELDAVLLTQQAGSVTIAVLAAMGRKRIACLCCDAKYIPLSCMLPTFVGCSNHLTVLQAQCSLSVPQKKRFWQSIVIAKIRGQSRNLLHYRQAPDLVNMYKRVLSGDSSHIESLAASIYWKRMNVFQSRNREAQDGNIIFNYVYSIIYAATARYVCVSGLEPQLGLQHSNHNNPFCLASDLMEVFRPFADDCILQNEIDWKEISSLQYDLKTLLCRQLYEYQVSFNGVHYHLFEAIRQFVLSFRAVLLEHTTEKLPCPTFLEK